ncbi:IclR family transcriptional regulator [Roseomonas sp. OT10]|uniref:IclR family transcriptional regulator n=1 Tax=Roseomonas cutis TaxID=2897332 RepID=UPI001E390742|nr:IclR family transcriptional regulator [Roseomonas sp. OT10]UFN49643.1 IclR family transcriptional regulator [Roseomonas sp. OT10]
MTTPTAPAAPRDYTVDAVDKAIQILGIIAANPGLGVSEIARRCGDSRARVFRLLRTLEGRDLVARLGETPAYRLGYAALLLGSAAAAQIDIARLAQPVMRELGRATDETVQLRVRDGTEALCIAKWEPDRDIRSVAVVGRRRPLHAGSGKLLLAQAPEEVRASVLAGLGAAEAAALAGELEGLRDAEAIVTRGELSSDAIGLAVPVRDHRGVLVALLHIGGPSQRFGEERVAAILDLLRGAARRLSMALGAAAS